MIDGLLRLLKSLHRLVLLAYPASLRREYAEEIREVFAQRLRAAASRSGGELVRVLARELFDSISTGLRARRNDRRPPSFRPIVRPANLTPSVHRGAAGTRAGTGAHNGAPARTGHGNATRTEKTPPLERLVLAMDTLFQDVRYALRSLLGSRGFTVTAVLVLGLGIGANAAIFSLVNAVILRPLPFTEADRLLAVFETNPERGWVQAQAAAANYLDWQQQATTLAGLAAHEDWNVDMALAGDDAPVTLRANLVTGNFFDVLGVRMLHGRGFDPEDTWAGPSNKVVLSQGLWERSFGSDPEIVGAAVVLSDETYEVLGVAPGEFEFPSDAVELWRPVAWGRGRLEDVSFRRAHGLRVIARLADGATVQEAEAELAAIAARLEAEYPETNTAMSTGVMPLHEWVVGDTRRPLMLLLSAVGFVLLIACANVANLQLARGSGRVREMAVRNALGAQPGRLLRQGLTESLMLSLLGGSLGLVLATGATRLVTAMSPDNLPRAAHTAVDGTVFVYTLTVTVLTAILFGLMPSWRASRPQLRGALSGTGRSSAGRESTRAAALLVAAEVALALPLAVGAGLMVRSLNELSQVELGFEPADTVAIGLSLPSSRYPDAETAGVFYDRLLDEVRQRPGVTGAALSTRLPFVNQRWSSDFRAEHWPASRIGVEVRHDEVSPGLFATLQVPILEGRDFVAADADGELVAIVNRALAERYFPDDSPVGRRLCFDRVVEDCRDWYDVVGIVDNVRRETLAADELPSIYALFRQNTYRGGYLLVRGAGSSAEPVAAVRAVVSEIDPGLPFASVVALDDVVDTSMARERLVLRLLGIFAVSAVLLAGIGVYGVTAHAITRRTREIGIRMALGAGRAEVLGAVLAQGLAPVAGGVVVGLLAAATLTRALGSLLYEVTPLDPLTYVAMAVVLLGVAAAACYLPARRATRVDPVVALCSE